MKRHLSKNKRSIHKVPERSSTTSLNDTRNANETTVRNHFSKGSLRLGYNYIAGELAMMGRQKQESSQTTGKKEKV